MQVLRGPLMRTVLFGMQITNQAFRFKMYTYLERENMSNGDSGPVPIDMPYMAGHAHSECCASPEILLIIFMQKYNN